eukprot:6247141-Amphidinium_carterae.2
MLKDIPVKFVTQDQCPQRTIGKFDCAGCSGTSICTWCRQAVATPAFAEKTKAEVQEQCLSNCVYKACLSNEEWSTQETYKGVTTLFQCICTGGARGKGSEYKNRRVCIEECKVGRALDSCCYSVCACDSRQFVSMMLLRMNASEARKRPSLKKCLEWRSSFWSGSV